MTDLIEQVARAICVVSGENPDHLALYKTGNIFIWEEYIPEAKAAIQALIDADWPNVGEYNKWNSMVINAKAVLQEAIKEHSGG